MAQIPTNKILEQINGSFGALSLACLMLYSFMSSYQELIDRIMTEHAEDRAMYQQTLTQLSEDLQNLSSNAKEITSEIEDIKHDLQRKIE